MDWSGLFLRAAQRSVPYFDRKDTDPQSDETRLTRNNTSVFR
jgi:hypothetical protein